MPPIEEFVARLVQAGASNEILAICVTFASRYARDDKQKAADRARRYRQRKRDAKRDDSVTQKEKVSTPLKEKTLSLFEGYLGKEGREGVSVARQERNKPEKSSFDLFYENYPLHVAKRAAAKAYAAALKRASPEEILAGVKRYKATAKPDFYAHPATWLNADRWLDELRPEPPAGPRPIMTVEEYHAKYG